MLTSRKAEAKEQYLLTGFFKQSLKASKNFIKTGV
jgi:hypothetical protein